MGVMSKTHFGELSFRRIKFQRIDFRRNVPPANWVRRFVYSGNCFSANWTRTQRFIATEPIVLEIWAEKKWGDVIKKESRQQHMNVLVTGIFLKHFVQFEFWIWNLNKLSNKKKKFDPLYYEPADMTDMPFNTCICWKPNANTKKWCIIQYRNGIPSFCSLNNFQYRYLILLQQASKAAMAARQRHLEQE